MILTDREIRIAIHRGLISIDPLPDESAERSAYSSTAVDLTLDPNIAIFDDPMPGLDNKIDPSVPGFRHVLNEARIRAGLASAVDRNTLPDAPRSHSFGRAVT